MKKLKVFYVAQDYQSHSRVAEVYRDLMQSECEIVTDGYDSDVVVLHLEPHDYDSIYHAYPALRHKYVIAYCVWEADDLPEPYKRLISLVQEVWTASRYCFNVFSKYHQRVVYMPHVIERDTYCSNAERDFIRRAIGYEQGCVYYLTVTKLLDKRKNVELLVKAFCNIRAKIPNARLIIKARHRDPPNNINEEQVIYMPRDLTWSQLNALYELAHVYVSAHHSEGWGLTLSDAMIFKRPVIATGYSGNLEFMNEENSFLVESKEEFIRPQDCFASFNRGMKWAYPDQTDLETKLLLLYENLNEDWVSAKVRKASVDINRFDRNAISGLLEKALRQIPR